MIELIEWLRIFILFHPSFVYIIMFLGVAFGGELVLFALAFLVAQNAVPILPFVVLSFLGTFFSNTLWFLFGKTAFITRIISHRYADTTISIIAKAVVRISKGNHFVALTVIKFLVGTSFVLIMYTNKTGLKWRQFVCYESIAILLWLLFYIPIGYFSGLGFNYLAEAFNNLYAAIGFILSIVLIIIVIQIWLERIFARKTDVKI